MSPKPKPKILITVTVAETAYSFLQEQVRYFLGKGYAVELACGEGNWIKLADVRKSLGVSVHQLPFTRPVDVFRDVASIVKLYFLLRKIRPNILHTSTPKAALLSLLCGWLARVPVRIYLVRGIPYCNETGLVKRFYVALFTLASSLAHVLICVSKSNRDFIVSNGICPPEKVSILCNGSSHGVDARAKFNRSNADPVKVAALRLRYGIGKGDVVFGFAGRIVRDKGIEDLAGAWATFSKGKHNVRLFVVGHKEKRDAVSAQCLAQLESDPTVHIVGDVIDPFEYYCVFDIFVFPSHREGFPNAVLEASAMETPVITTNAQGCVDSVLNGQTGYVVPPRDQAALVDKMEKLYSNTDLRMALGRNGRKHVLDNFDPGELCAALEKVVRSQCEKSRVLTRPRMAIVTTVPTTLYHLFSNQIDRIRSAGFEIFLVSSPGDEWITAKAVERKYGIPVHQVPFQRTFSIFSDMRSLAALCLFFVKVKPDVIYYCTPKASLVAGLAAYIARVPYRIYAIFGQVYYESAGLTEKVLLLAEKISCAVSHKVILMSKSNLDYLLAKRLCNPRKVGILGHGTNQGVDAIVRFNPERIDPAQAQDLRRHLAIRDGATVFGYIGRLVRDKGIVELVNAWETVSQANETATLLLIGPRKEPRDQLPEAIYKRIATDPTITLVEQVANPELYYSIMDVFVLPSHREGFPNVVLEAAAMELPVITTDAIGCVDSVVDNKTGFIVPRKNVEKLKEKMALLLGDAAMRKAMGKQARKRAIAEFSSEKVTDDLMYLIENREFGGRVSN